jgi:hypothetical protein
MMDRALKLSDFDELLSSEYFKHTAGTGITLPREPLSIQEYVSVIVHMSSYYSTLNTGIVFQSLKKKWQYVSF